MILKLIFIKKGALSGIMKIFAASDLHGDQSLAERLAERAEKEQADLVILAGDITHNDTSTKSIIGPFVKRQRKVMIIPGNHDSITTVDFLAEMYGIKNMHGYSATYGDIGFFGCGGATVGPHTQMSDEEIFSTLKYSHEQVKDAKKKVMITHVHPSGSKIERFSQFFPGSEGVTRAIKEFKPDIVLCGHIHEAAGIEEILGKSRVINVGKVGKVIEL